MKKKILTWVLLISLLVCLFPAAAFAVWEHGSKGTAELTKILIGKDGKRYYINEDVKTVFYEANGRKVVKPGNGLSKLLRRYLKITDKKDGRSRYGYCVEFGAGFNSKADYKASKAQNAKSLFRRMPEDAQKIIAAVLCYGRSGTGKVPVASANDADYYYATQIMIWEAQQGLRTISGDKGTRLAAAHGMPANHMYKSLKGRPAEKCYKWLRDKVNDHLTTHSFAAETAGSAPVHLMKYDKTAEKWSVVLTDTNKKASGIIVSDPRIQVTRSGWQYTLESREPIGAPALVTIKNQMIKGRASGNLLVWNCTSKPSNQAMILGSADLFSMYFKVATDSSAQVLIEKQDAETNKPVTGASATYEVTDADTGSLIAKNLKTGKDGKALIPRELHPGTYELKEVQAPEGYRIAETPVRFSVNSNSGSLTLAHKNMPQKGIIRVVKSGERFRVTDGAVNTEKEPLAGVVFQIFAAQDIVTKDGTIRLKAGGLADTITTDKEGKSNSKELYPGNYNIVEKETCPGYVLLTEPVPVELSFAGQEAALALEEVSITNELSKGTVEVEKTDVSTGEPLPNTGIEILDEKQQLLLQTRTDAAGRAVFPQLPTGKYFFREFDPPKGYQIDEQSFPFEIKENGEAVKCRMSNRMIPDRSPETGDDFPVKSCILAAVAGVFIIFLIYKRRRRY